MCHFVTATMSPDADEQAVRRLAKVALLKWIPLENSRVREQLLAGERYFFTTRGMCDCGTEIGMAARHDASLPPLFVDRPREVKKRQKRGWSEAKIERWLAQANADARRKHREAQQRLAGPYPGVRRWIEFASAVLNGGHARWIGILLHWYRGRLDSERIRIDQRRWLPLAEFHEDCLLQAEEDVLLTVSLDGKRG